MPRYTFEELVDILFIYGLCNENERAAEREYANRYPGRPVPDHRMFETVHRRLRERGTLVPYEYENVSQIQYEVNTDEQVLNSVRRDPTISTRRLSIQLGISKNKVWRVLRRNHLHPFHYTPVQELLPVDLPNRANFCRLLLNNEEHNPLYLSSILWTDESTFTRDGITNFHNLHEWQPENPHVKRESSFQRRFSVNVWCGIIGNNFIGPILLPERLNSQNYLEFLNETAPTVLDSIPLMMRNTFLYQQDGAPAHHGRQVLNWFDINYPGRWIGRSGPIAWPARSPDLTPLDFYVWGYLKGEVYKTNIQTREQNGITLTQIKIFTDQVGYIVYTTTDYIFLSQ